MNRSPRVSGAEVAHALQQGGFSIVRQKGSHAFLRHGDGRLTVGPLHEGDSIGPGLLSRILCDAGMNRERFERLLSEG